MDATKLEELKAKAARATEVAEQIEQLEAALVFGVLDRQLASEVFQAGKAAMIAQKESELSAILEPLGISVAEHELPLPPAMPWQPPRFPLTGDMFPPATIYTSTPKPLGEEIRVTMQEGSG